MGQNCCICAHPKRKEIDKALVAPKPNFSAIARIFDTNRDSVRRHLEGGHVAEKIKKAADAQEALDADDLLGEIKETERITKDIITAAMTRKKTVREGGKEKTIKTPDHDTALKALARREKQIELKGKILGSFKGDKPQSAPVQELTDEEVEARARAILAKHK